MPGVFKLCASCLGYNALGQREEARVPPGQIPEEAALVETTTTTTKPGGARMGILKMKREKDLGDEGGGLQRASEATSPSCLRIEEEGLLACKDEDGEGEEEERDSGACVDEFPVTARESEANSGEGKEADATAEALDARDMSRRSQFVMEKRIPHAFQCYGALD